MCTVLVIDDDAAVSEILCQALTWKGFSVVSATNGRDGLARFSEQRFDVVVTDIRMPLMSGIDVLAEIRRSERGHIPVIGISGTPRLLEDTGFDRHFVKPFSVRELVVSVRAICASPGLNFSLSA